METQSLPIDLLNEELKLSLLLQRYRPVTITETSKALSEALDNIQMKLIKTEDLTQRARLKYLEKQIVDELGTAYKVMPDAIKQDMSDVAETAYTTTSNALLTHGATQIVFADLPKNAIKEMMDMNQITLLDGKGYKISDFVDNQLGSHTKRFKQIVAAGIAEGATIPTIARRLKDINTRVKRNDLQAITRTVVAEARGRGQLKAFDVADDVITSWQSIGTLDSRTSLRCGALDGKIWYKSKGYTVEQLKAKNYWYPRHFNCRSVVVPRTEISAKLDKDRTRASVDGQVSSKTKFQDFFDSQSEDFKRGYLGNAKYKLYVDNKLQIKDFVDIKSGREFSIVEIYKHQGITKVSINKGEKLPTTTIKEKFSAFGIQIANKMESLTDNIHPNAKKMIMQENVPNSISQTGGYFSYYDNSIHMSKKSDSTWLHEYGHYLDYSIGEKHGATLVGSFEAQTILRSGKRKLVDVKNMGYKDSFTKAIKEDRLIYQQNTKQGRANIDGFITEYREFHYSNKETTAFEEMGGISDIIDALTHGYMRTTKRMAGHGKKYYRQKGMVQKEIMANLFEAYANHHKWERMKKYVPKLANTFEKYITHYIDGTLSEF